MNKNNGSPASSVSAAPPRRIVLLAGDNDSAVKKVLAEYDAAEGAKVDAHEQARRLAAEHAGQCVAIEWQGDKGWMRFAWCRRPKV